MRFFPALIVLACLCFYPDAQAATIDPPVKNNTRYGPQKYFLKRLARHAKRFTGSPYVYGGTKPEGFDCSGYVRYVFDEFNLKLNQNSVGLSKIGYEVQTSQAQPGDLVFFDTKLTNGSVGHVGIVVSNTEKGIEFIHASSSRGVIQSFLHEKYYRQHFLSVNRVMDELRR